MLFTNTVFAVLAQSLAASAATMTVTVAANNKFQFTPNSITAQPGDMVAFNFVAQVSCSSSLILRHRELTEAPNATEP